MHVKGSIHSKDGSPPAQMERQVGGQFCSLLFNEPGSCARMGLRKPLQAAHITGTFPGQLSLTLRCCFHFWALPLNSASVSAWPLETVWLFSCIWPLVPYHILTFHFCPRIRMIQSYPELPGLSSP